MDIHPKKGDPILSIDGKTIAAIWAVDVEIPAGASFRWSWHNPREIGEPVEMRQTPYGSELANTASIALDYASPAARVWRVVAQGGDPDGMFTQRWFAHPRAQVGPDAAGVARAIEVVLSTCKMFPDAERALKYNLDAWRHRADRERVNLTGGV